MKYIVFYIFIQASEASYRQLCYIFIVPTFYPYDKHPKRKIELFLPTE